LKKSNAVTAAILIIIIVMLAIINYFFIPNNSVTTPFERGGTNLVIDGNIINTEEQPRIIDGEVLLSFNNVKKYIDPNIFWDKNLKRITVTTKGRIIRMKTGSLNALVNNKSINLNIPVSIYKSSIYLPINFLSDFYNFDIEYIKLNNVVVIEHRMSIKRYACPIAADAVIRKGSSIRFPIIYKLNDLSETFISESKIQEMPRIFADNGKWYRVKTVEGAVGFIEKKYVSVKEIVSKNQADIPENISQEPVSGKINLVWEMMYQGRPDLSAIKEMNGLDVISPTWFQLINQKGDVINRSDAAYVGWAHSKGYKVWALLSNGFDGEMTEKFLNDTDSRGNLIRQMLIYSSLYKLDGINIDFENVNAEDKSALTQFFREITPLLKEQGLVVSADINSSASYDKKEIADTVDYIMVMTYDQHWKTSPTAGSVAQIKWVENWLVKYLDSIPREKLLLGIPFYTRLWKETTDSRGNITLSCTSLKMEEAKRLVKENNAKVTWDNESGQFYTEYKKEGSTYKIWLEDQNSIDLKSSLVLKYQLAGTAAWSRTFESPEIWDVLNRNLKELNSYNEWLQQWDSSGSSLRFG
jgi:spore germination protein YaaH